MRRRHAPPASPSSRSRRLRRRPRSHTSTGPTRRPCRSTAGWPRTPSGCLRPPRRRVSESTAASLPVVVVTGANGLVGSRITDALVERGAAVRAVVRRPGAAPALPHVEEWVGDFFDPDLAEKVVAGATAVVTTVHPMGSDLESQRRIAVDGTPVLARAARDAGVERLVHISTAGVYDRSPWAGDVDEGSPLVGDDAGAYAVTKRDTDAALAEIGGITRVLLRPPA